VPGGYLDVMFYLLGAGTGVSVALQQVVNANLLNEVGSPWSAGFISYLFRPVAMLAVTITSVEPWLSETVTAPTEYRDGLTTDIPL
jgi:bacterial/archaeal transporter family-2 protein